MKKRETVDTRIASIYRDENEIIVITMKDCGKVDEFDVLDVNLVIRNLSKNKAAYKLLDAKANWNMDAKAKERAKLENSVTKTSARAVVVSSIVKSTLLKFLQSFSKFDYPQKTFTDFYEAYDWLLALKNKK